MVQGSFLKGLFLSLEVILFAWSIVILSCPGCLRVAFEPLISQRESFTHLCLYYSHQNIKHIKTKNLYHLPDLKSLRQRWVFCGPSTTLYSTVGMDNLWHLYSTVGMDNIWKLHGKNGKWFVSSELREILVNMVNIQRVVFFISRRMDVIKTLQY